MRAAIFDVYGTLLEVGPAPHDADALWHRLWMDMFGMPPRLSRLDFSVACSRVIARLHETARARGVAHPEVNWQGVVAGTIPEFSLLSPSRQDEFLWRQIRSGHSTSMAPQTAEVLRRFKRRGCVLGIASNAQAYTLGELGQHLHEHGLGMDCFEPDLVFWSYQHGFSKPDPHVFQLLSTRLGLRHIPESETLMIGDRLDNDVTPARAHGWRAWHLSPPGHPGDGGFAALLEAMDSGAWSP